MDEEELIMIDNDGIPIKKKAETISYSDIYSTNEDKQRISINKAYAEGSQYKDDPSKVEEKKKPSINERIKAGFIKGKDNMKHNAQFVFNTIKQKAKEKITMENTKKAGNRLVGIANTVGENGRKMFSEENKKEQKHTPKRTVIVKSPKGITSLANAGLLNKRDIDNTRANTQNIIHEPNGISNEELFGGVSSVSMSDMFYVPEPKLLNNKKKKKNKQKKSNKLFSMKKGLF
jgi:hypothetical protein